MSTKSSIDLLMWLFQKENTILQLCGTGHPETSLTMPLAFQLEVIYFKIKYVLIIELIVVTSM